jgi:hypothetical protein
LGIVVLLQKKIDLSAINLLSQREYNHLLTECSAALEQPLFLDSRKLSQIIKAECANIARAGVDAWGTSALAKVLLAKLRMQDSLEHDVAVLLSESWTEEPRSFWLALLRLSVGEQAFGLDRACEFQFFQEDSLLVALAPPRRSRLRLQNYCN